MCVQGRKIEDQQDQAVLAAIIGERQLVQTFLTKSVFTACISHPDSGYTTHVYLLNASPMTPRLTLVCSCTLLSLSVLGSRPRNAYTFPWTLSHCSCKDCVGATSSFISPPLLLLIAEASSSRTAGILFLRHVVDNPAVKRRVLAAGRGAISKHVRWRVACNRIDRCRDGTGK